MSTNTVETSPLANASRLPAAVKKIALGAGLALLASLLQAGPTPGPWTPIFKGIDLALGTNNPGTPGDFTDYRQVVRCVRVDLTDPDVQVTCTPGATNPVVESRETLTQTVPNFLRQHSLQVAADANYYNANPGGADPNSEGISCDVYGLEICEGKTVSPQTTGDATDPRYAAILFTSNNVPAMVFVNRPPGTNTTGIYTAITGYYPIVSNGVNIGNAASAAYPDTFIHQVQPRTAYGISQDSRYLYLMTIDGRQSGYSDGALDAETAYWLIQFGAWNGINMDGGGSTAMYMSDSAGNPVGLNHSSYLAAYGHERYVGSSFGVRAKPLPGYINDVIALPDDTAATITWTTTNASTSLVQYGLTTSLGSSTPYDPTLVTNHSALLTGLSPGTGYYFRVFSSDGAGNHGAGIFFFTTTNYSTPSLIFDLTNSWTYDVENLDGVNWTAPAYDDSGWLGAGPGVLWVDTVYPNGGNPSITVPLLTEMPGNPATGFPYPTYYFRTHFAYTNGLKGVTLQFTDYLDDGAVFYLNGAEVYRQRMPAYPTPIVNSTLASGYPCTGNATCPDSFEISGDLTTNLLSGDNVLAVEAHNYSAGSPDITFGLALSFSLPFSPPPSLNIQQSDAGVSLSWARGGFTLQQAGSPSGPWTNAPGPVVSSPYVLPSGGAAQFYRLVK